MTGPFVRISSALLATLVVVGCRTEPVTWQVPLHDVILLNDTLSWSNLIPDTLWSQGEEGLVLEVNTTGNWIDPEALVPNLTRPGQNSSLCLSSGDPSPFLREPLCGRTPKTSRLIYRPQGSEGRVLGEENSPCLSAVRWPDH